MASGDAAPSVLPTLVVPLLESQPTVVMSNCDHNQIESLAMRYLKHTPCVNLAKISIPLLCRIIVDLGNKIKEFYRPEFSFNKYVANKPGAVRRRFLKAYKQLASGSRDINKNSRISAFIKNERYFEEGKSPRSIMGRDPKFNIVYARFVARFEDAFFQLKQVCNACDYPAMGVKFAGLYEKCQRMFENDMSKFEATQRYFHLLIEFLVMAAVTPESELEDLETVFAAKIMKPVGYGSGVSADFECCRGSGDLDTGCGNGVINYVSTAYFKIINFCTIDCDLVSCKCGWDDFVLKGDDSYGTAPFDADRPYINTYEWFGLDAKLVDRPDGRLTEFCSGHFIRVGGGWTYVQKLRKIITSVSTCINTDVIKNGWLGHYIRSLGDMYKVLYAGVPVYEDFADLLRTAYSRSININLVEGVSYGAFEAYKVSHNTKRVDATTETHLDISLVNDMPIAQLCALQETFNRSRISLPLHLLHRCNLKSQSIKTEVLDTTLSQWVKGLKLGKVAANYRRKLVYARHNMASGLKKAAQDASKTG